MTCHDLDADVVDAARGADVSAATRIRVGKHLEECPACTARFAQEQQLTAALKIVASSAPGPRRSAVIEQDLLRAFAAHQASASTRSSASRPVLAAAARGWLAAAAVLVLAVVGWLGSAPWRSSGEAPPAATQALTGRAESAPAEAVAGPRVETDAQTAPAHARPPVASAPARPSRARVNRAVPTGNDEVLRFVALPSADGLPGLESGRIVRVKLPTVILPAYGLDVVPDADARVVEADVLVGQDGQPRAIRFVSLNSDPRRRQ